MSTNKPIEVLLSKSKLTKMLIGSIVFVLLGCWILIYQPDISNPLLNNPVVKYSIGMASILFFGFGVVSCLKKLTDKKPGIIITETGLIDNSSAVSAGHIPWSDIKGISTVKVMKQEFLVIEIFNPSYYINEQSNLLKKKAMEYNYKSYGSPHTISANSLKCDLKELMNLIENRLLKPSQEAALVEDIPTKGNKDELIGVWENDLDDGSGLHAIWGIAFQFNEDGTGLSYSWQKGQIDDETPFHWERISENTMRTRYSIEEEWEVIEYTITPYGNLLKLTENKYQSSQREEEEFQGALRGVFKRI